MVRHSKFSQQSQLQRHETGKQSPRESDHFVTNHLCCEHKFVKIASKYYRLLGSNGVNDLISGALVLWGLASVRVIRAETPKNEESFNRISLFTCGD